MEDLLRDFGRSFRSSLRFVKRPFVKQCSDRSAGGGRLLRPDLHPTGGAGQIERVYKLAGLGEWEWWFEPNGDPAWLRWSGLAADVLAKTDVLPTYKDFLDALHPDDIAAWNAAMCRSFDLRVPIDVEIRLKERKGAGFKWFRFAGEVASERGETMRMAGVLQDIGDLKRLELLLLHAQKNEALGQLAGGIAHDVGNLLTIVNGQLSHLKRSMGNTDHRLVEAMDDAISAVAEGTALTRRLVDFVRSADRAPEQLNIAQEIDDIADLLKLSLGNRIDLRIDTAKNLPPVIIGRVELQLALLNLVLNARDAMPDGGDIVIRADIANRKPEYREISGEAGPETFVRLSVSDTGTGIPPETQSRVVEPFFTTKGPEQGSGIGLSTVYGMASRAGGYLDIDSDVGKGTEVSIFLPRA